MDSTIVDLLQLNDNTDMAVGSTNYKLPYVSMFRINGKPILPPLINDEKKLEMQRYKIKAIETEIKLAKLKSQTANKINQNSSESSSFLHIPPSCQSTPARPATLNLNEKVCGKTSVLSESKTEGFLKKHAVNTPLHYGIKSSQRSTKVVKKSCKSTLEQRLACNEMAVRNKKNNHQQSPIVEEQYPEQVINSDSDSRSEKKSWSPLQTESLNSLKIKFHKKSLLETDDDNIEMSLDESLNTPETVTQSPNLMRQNSYTLLTPSPALLSYLESQKQDEKGVQRPQSGRKTWDLTKAKKKWGSNNEDLCRSSDQDTNNDEMENPVLNKKNNSSVDSFLNLMEREHSDPGSKEQCFQYSTLYDSGTSPDSCSYKKSIPKLSKIKCKIKGKKPRSVKTVPPSKLIDKVPLKMKSARMQGAPHDFVPNNELSELSNLLLKMKMDHEREKKELEEKQQSEMKQLEVIFQRKEVELLTKVSHLPRKYTRSIYSQSSQETTPQEFNSRMMGDGSHNRTARLSQLQCSRPHSVKDLHSQLYSNESDFGRRARSVGFNQDTDLDISFQDDSIQSKNATLNNEYIESDSVSNFSSHSSTVSSENKPEPLPAVHLKKFQGISSEEYAKYNKAASKINAAVRGFFVRRLLQTAHVQGLITTLKDAITCATQLHTAPDIGDSDIDLMRRLSRQIEAAWDAVYSVFFDTDTAYRLQLIASDRERLKAVTAKTSASNIKKKRISAATKKSLDRKKGGSLMSKSQTSNGFSRVRVCSKMSSSYPSAFYSHKLK